MVADPEFEARLERAKAASTPQLLFKCARLLNEQAIARFAQRSNRDVRVAHTALFPHIDLEGTRLTELARRMDMTKQAAGQLVDELERMGMLERAPDPSDGRAKLIRFTDAGRRSLFDGLEVLGEFQCELTDALGERTMQQLHRALTRLLEELERE